MREFMAEDMSMDLTLFSELRSGYWYVGERVVLIASPVPLLVQRNPTILVP